MAKKAKLVETLEAKDIEIKKDSYFVNAYTVDLPLDAIPDHVGRTFSKTNGNQADTYGSENCSQ